MNRAIQKDSNHSPIKKDLSKDLEKDLELEEILQFQWSKQGLPEDIYFFAEKLIRGSIQHLDCIDPLIEHSSEHFKPSEIFPIDQSILRFSVYALLFQKEISPSIIMNEAIELARKFGGDESFRFINGMLDGIHRHLQRSQKDLFPMKKENLKENKEIKKLQPIKKIKQRSVQKVSKGPKLFVACFVWIFAISSFLWAQQSEIPREPREIILGEVEYLDGLEEEARVLEEETRVPEREEDGLLKQEKQSTQQKSSPAIRTQTNTPQTRTDSSIPNPTPTLSAELIQKMKVEIQNLFQMYLSQINASKNQVKKRNYRLQILSIRVGNDQPKQQIQDSSLPITVTVLSPAQYREAKLQLFAKNRQTQVSELIYEIERFQLNQHWAQDQLIWRGTFQRGAETLMLSPGIYDIQCSIQVLGEEKNISRFWGKGLSQYYVQIQ